MSMIKIVRVLKLLLFGCFICTHSQLTIITRPDALLTSTGNIVEGSVIQIYCTVEMDNGVSFTWTFNGSALLNDPPHIRIRTDKDGPLLTSVLTVDNFRDTDNGVYQCSATDGVERTGNGTAIYLKVMMKSSTPPPPVDPTREITFTNSNTDAFTPVPSITPSTVATDSPTPGISSVYLSLGSRNITTNNTEILITDIGEDAPGGRPSLTCHTDLVTCCRNSDTGGQGGLGEWYYPDGRVVPNNAVGENFCRVRNAPQIVRLARRQSINPLSPTGLYCCVIPTTQGEMTLCASISLSPVHLSLGSSRAITTNNTEILITDIGQDASSGLPTLTCHTDLVTCCRNNDTGGQGGMGEWYYPNGRAVPNQAAGEDLYRVRNAPQVVRLARRDSINPLVPTGSYCCVIPTTQGLMTLCIRIAITTRTCLSLPTLPNGGVMINYNNPTLAVGTVATYTSTCVSGYYLSGGSNRTCLANGTWSGVDPTCEVFCDTLPSPSNGRVTYNNSLLVAGTEATYNCDRHYYVIGDTTRICQRGGIWAGLEPSCEEMMYGTLRILNGPSDNEPADLAAILNDNRTGIALGGTVDGSLLTCTVGHQGDEVIDYSPPSVVWVRNGQVVDDTDSRITLANGQLSSSLTITNFTQSDVGVYQCVFTDVSEDGEDAEVVTTLPYRLDTGGLASIERVSPEVIILRPPEKLVIEVKSSGEYAVHFWRKNENIFTSSGFPATLPDEFPNFAEIFVRGSTTSDDVGVYRVHLLLKPGTGQTHSIMPVGGVEFVVIAPVDANTTALTTDTVVILEGGSANISCRSVGAPAPSITWELDNQITSFEQTDTVTQFEAILTGSSGARDVLLTPGNIVSDLRIVNAKYPYHDGVYTCIGMNSGDTITGSTASVLLLIHVIPEVVITTTHTRVNLGDDRTLTCSVLRGSPTNYTHHIVSLNTMATTSGLTLVLTDIQQSDLGTYRCDVTNDAGTGSANITIELGDRPTVSPVQPDPVVVDTTIDLVCTVTGDLPIEIIWIQTQHNGTTKVFFRGDDNTGGNTTLLIGENDYGTYNCTASNHLGTNTSSIEIIQAVGPVLEHLNDYCIVVTNTLLKLSVNIASFNLPLTNINWFVNGVPTTEVFQRERNITINNSDLMSPPVISVLTINPVFETGMYSVVATNDVGSDTATFYVSSACTSLIQLRLKGIKNCQSWVVNDGPQKIDTVTSILVKNVDKRCHCGFSRSNVVSPMFRCFTGSEDTVTYRAEISGTPLVPHNQIITFIEEWVSENAQVTFDDMSSILIDNSCQVGVTSIMDPECTSSKVNTLETVGVAVGAIIALLILLVAIIVIIVTLGICAKRLKSRSRAPDNPLRVRYAVKPTIQEDEYEDIYQNDPSKPTVNESDDYDDVHITPVILSAKSTTHTVTSDHNYECVHSEARKTNIDRGEEFELTQCTAYKTIHRGEEVDDSSVYAVIDL